MYKIAKLIVHGIERPHRVLMMSNVAQELEIRSISWNKNAHNVSFLYIVPSFHSKFELLAPGYYFKQCTFALFWAFSIKVSVRNGKTRSRKLIC